MTKMWKETVAIVGLALVLWFCALAVKGLMFEASLDKQLRHLEWVGWVQHCRTVTGTRQACQTYYGQSEEDDPSE